MEKKHVGSRLEGIRFVVTALPGDCARPNELARTMAAHPLIHRELPYNPEYTIYNRRLASVGMDSAGADEVYWMVRRKVILRHTGGLPIEVRGPDAEKLLDLWSPFRQCGVALVRLDDPELGTGADFEVECTEGETRSGVTCDTPMYDRKREIPRGKLVDIPEIPAS